MIDQKVVDTLRLLSVDMIAKANSGHPGLPLGAAPMAYTLWDKHLKHNPKNSNWVDRDRFILSAGHGSALLYSLLHIFGYDLSLEDLKEFRQLNSRTPGHPEYGYTDGVEATTGPLGQGIGNAVGMAMTEAFLAETFNQENFDIVNHYTYALCGEGCLMEGISHEASSLAGTLELDKLIVLFDSNDITIEGNIKITFTEDIKKRYEAYGWQVLEVEDGNDLKDISKAISKAKEEKHKPSFIMIKTDIGFGSPVADSAAAHGNPIKDDALKDTKEFFGFDKEASFVVPKEVEELKESFISKGEKEENAWNTLFAEYKKEYPDLYKKWEQFHSPIDINLLLEDEDIWEINEDLATRAVSGQILNKITDHVPNLFGGSGDLAPSTQTEMMASSFFSSEDREGSNIHFGVREHAMTAIANGMALHGGVTPYVGGFLIFSDYMKPAMRLSALMNLPVINILTHDSIGVGEDGPTHQPIEQIAGLRSIPNFTVIRPCDNKETAAAWTLALTRKSPTALILTRQGLPQQEESSTEALHGGYIIHHEKDLPEMIFIATGSEVHLAVEAAKELEGEIDIRVISMPSIEIFEEQREEYKEDILPSHIEKRVIVEAGTSFGWHKYVKNGSIVSVDSFGASAPGDELFSHFNITKEEIIKRAKELQ